MKSIKTEIRGKLKKVFVREYLGMYQIIQVPYALGLIRKSEVLCKKK